MSSRAATRSLPGERYQRQARFSFPGLGGAVPVTSYRAPNMFATTRPPLCPTPHYRPEPIRPKDTSLARVDPAPEPPAAAQAGASCREREREPRRAARSTTRPMAAGKKGGNCPRPGRRLPRGRPRYRQAGGDPPSRSTRHHAMRSAAGRPVLRAGAWSRRARSGGISCGKERRDARAPTEAVRRASRHAWNGSWNAGAESPSVLGAAAALSCVIGAGSGPEALEHGSCKRQVEQSRHPLPN